jgi:hypothetical protein
MSEIPIGPTLNEQFASLMDLGAHRDLAGA